jgi:hypothetical protein
MAAMVTGCVFCEVCAQTEVKSTVACFNCLFTANCIRHLGKQRMYKQDTSTTVHY